jgi:hypothetical protein
MEAQGERKYSSYSFTTSALDGVSGQRRAPATLYPRGKSPPPHPYPFYRGWVDPRAGLDTEATGKILFAFAGDRTWIAWSSSP